MQVAMTCVTETSIMLANSLAVTNSVIFSTLLGGQQGAGGGSNHQGGNKNNRNNNNRDRFKKAGHQAGG